MPVPGGHVRVVDRATAGARGGADARYDRVESGHPSGFVEAFANFCWDFADAIVEFRTHGSVISPHVFGAHQAAEGLRMFEAIAQSAASRVWRKVSE